MIIELLLYKEKALFVSGRNVKIRKLKKRLMIIFMPLILSGLFLYFENNALSITKMTIESERLPKGFDGYKILQISDLHSKSFGKDQKGLVDSIKKLNPNMIVITGDLVDSKRYNEDNSISLVKQAVEIAPVYYVTGNHEWWSGRFSSLENKLKDAGIRVLRNEKVLITESKDSLQLLGIDDPEVFNGMSEKDNLMYLDYHLSKLKNRLLQEDFTILLSHRPEHFSIYAKNNIDLTFSGHAHGGQVRIPFLGGVIAPNQGLLPKYSAGVYKLEDSYMVVSRGLGNSIIPQRLFNRPELVLVTLSTPKSK